MDVSTQAGGRRPQARRKSLMKQWEEAMASERIEISRAEAVRIIKEVFGAHKRQLREWMEIKNAGNSRRRLSPQAEKLTESYPQVETALKGDIGKLLNKTEDELVSDMLCKCVILATLYNYQIEGLPDISGITGTDSPFVIMNPPPVDLSTAFLQANWNRPSENISTAFLQINGDETPWENIPVQHTGGAEVIVEKITKITSDVDRQMWKAWLDSERRNFWEHGGLIHINENGNYVISTMKSLERDSIGIPYDPTAEAQFHTHPYPKEEGGHVGVGFSADDIVAMQNAPYDISFIEAKTKRFALVTVNRYKFCALNEEQIRNMYNAPFNQAQNDKKSHPECVMAAIKAIANRDIGIRLYQTIDFTKRVFEEIR